MSWVLNGKAMPADPEITTGDTVGVYLTFGPGAAGNSITFTFPDPVIVPGTVPNNIGFVDDIEADPDNDTVTLHFSDNITSSSNEGAFNLSLDHDDVTGERELAWQLGDEGGTATVLIVNKDDSKFTGAAGGTKGVDQETIWGYVTIDDDGSVSLSDNAANVQLTYTLTLTHDGQDAAPNMSFSDELPEGLEYIGDSFVLEYEVWGANGYNYQNVTEAPTITPSGTPQSFDYTYGPAEPPNADQPWRLTLTYKAKLTVAGLAEMEGQLQDALEGLGDGSGAFHSESWTNTAEIGGEYDAEKSFRFGGNKPKAPGVESGDFWKEAPNWNANALVEIDDEGSLVQDRPITYRFGISWNNWDTASKDKDILIVDTLPDGTEWDTTAERFLNWSGGTLDEATGACESKSLSPGQYCTEGQTLIVNLGPVSQMSGDSTFIDVKANVVALDMDSADENVEAGITTYDVRNTGTFHVGVDGEGVAKTANVTTKVRGDGPVRDESLFQKSGGAQSPTAEVGGTITFEYTIRVAEGAGVDARTSYIVDYIDPIPEDLFELDADLSNVTVTMTYAGATFSSADFDVSLDESGDIVIKLTDSGIAKVGDNTDKAWVVNIVLKTRELRGDSGRESVEVQNRASLFGLSGESYQDASGTSSATSYGDGLELAKRVFDCKVDVESGENQWKESVSGWIDGDGTLLQDTYVFRLELLPHGSYGQSGLVGPDAIDFDDVLPPGLSFQGFVDPADLDCEPNTLEEWALQGNLVVSALQGDSQGVNVTVKEGERFDPNAGPYLIYIAASVEDEVLAGDSITNVFGSSEARVDFLQPSILIEKWTEEESSDGPDFAEDGNITNDGYDGDFDDAEDPKLLAPKTDELIKFTVSNNGDEALTNLLVTDELVDGVGELTDLQCDYPEDGVLHPGVQFTCEAALPGLAPGQTHQNRAQVTAEGYESEIPVEDTDDWNAKTAGSYAIGDYVWIDSNRDGVQDEDEDPLAGVTVTLTDLEGNPVEDVFGDEVQPTATSPEGRYIFDQLPAGEYQVKFTLTEEHAEKYIFTKLMTGNDESTNDSDADPATGWTKEIILNADNAALTTDYVDQDFSASEGIDPTWDAGVIRKAVSVGDYVWVDENRDGTQDEGEPGLPDVTLCLIGPDGEPVTDVFGDTVGPVVTDENGYYSFENLPALQGDETYTVCIDREASEEALKPYSPTKEHQGDDRGEDSSTWEASTEPGDLHNDGDRDPTLDFGFVTKSYAIGDYVWIDSNGDGVQGEDEDPLEGVTVELYDSEGELIASTTTDEHGRYLFDNLPAGNYKVKFTLTEEQAAIYEFTSLNTGNDESSNDSDADPATGWTQDIVLGDSNDALTLEYDRELGATEGIDPTWDAGVVLKLVAPDEVPGPDDLPEMGAEINGPLIGLAALLLLAGAATIGLVRRQS